MPRNAPLRNMMPYMELAPSAASFVFRAQHQQKQRPRGPPSHDTRDPRRLRHFGAGTVRGVFRPHRRPPPAPTPTVVDAEAAEAQEEDAMLRRWAREGGLGSSSSSSSSSSGEVGGKEGSSGGGSGGGSEYDKGEEEEEVGVMMDVELKDPALLPAHVPRPLWRFPDEWTDEGAEVGSIIRHGLGLQRYVSLDDCSFRL